MNRDFLKYFITSVILSILLIGGKAIAAENFYSVMSAIESEAGKSSSRIHLNVTSESAFKSEELFNILMPTGGSEIGKVTRTIQKGPSLSAMSKEKAVSTTIISLENNRGSLEVTSLNDQPVSLLFYDNQERKYFRADIDSNGDGVFKEEGLEAYQCPELPTATNSLFEMPQVAGLTPDLTLLKSLESKPGASNTLYINYWGGTLTDTAWNDSSNSGNPIDYSAYDNDDDPSTFSDNERYLMWLAWQETAEDYSSFDVNVTTSQAIYDATASTNRSQIIGTTTDYFYPGAGGVAYVGIFGRSDDYYNTGFSWNHSAGSMGMTHSHEAGHQMGLDHDATSRKGYYGGHGNWGPIMGAPFDKPFVQWSKGEYPDANNSENDLVILSGVLGVSGDDAGNTIGAATPLVLPVIDQEGHIRPDGISADTDVYSFTLTSSGVANVEVIPLLGIEGESRAANLAMDASLKDSSNNIIASVTSSDNLPLNPSTNKLTYSGVLAAGTYYISVTGISPDQNWSTGFGEYGNEGLYYLSVETAGGTLSPEITFPTPSTTLSGDTETFVWNDNDTADISEFLVSIGTSGVNSTEIYSENFSGAEDSTLVTGLPTDGSIVYVRLSWEIDGSWYSADYTYTATTAAVADDFYVTDSRLASSSVKAGKKLKVFTTQAYAGSKKKAQLKPYPYVGYYLSEDDQLDSNDQLLAKDRSKLGSDNVSDAEFAKVTIPSSTLEGDYYILFVADYKGSHSEDNEGNNVQAVPLSVSVSIPDDFYVTDSRLASETVKAGKKVKAFTTQAYAGDKVKSQLKPFPYVGYYLSEDALLDGNDTLLAKDISRLGSNNVSDEEFARLKIPSSTPEGAYYILFVADYRESHVEANESNNLQAVGITIQ